MTSAGRIDRLVGGALAAAGLAIVAEATTFDVVFLTDPVGPKALPLLAGVTLAASGLRAFARPRERVELPDRRPALRMVGALAALCAYAFALPWLGFFASTSLVVFGLSLLYDGPRRGSAAVAVSLAGALWLLFAVLLALPLPVGDLWIL